MNRLGYMVYGEEQNTSNFGLPQQRRRAWLICLRRDQCCGESADKISEDMARFHCPMMPLAHFMYPEKSGSSRRIKVAGKRGKLWKKGFEEQCEIYGKAGMSVR